jgi:exonuclease III
MRLAALNVRGLGDAEKVTLVIAWLREFRMDLAILSETHITEDLRVRYAQRWKQFQWFTNGLANNAVGITGIVLNPDRIKDCQIEWPDDEGRVIAVSFIPKDAYKRTTLVGVYAIKRTLGVPFRKLGYLTGMQVYNPFGFSPILHQANLSKCPWLR